MTILIILIDVLAVVLLITLLATVYESGRGRMVSSLLEILQAMMKNCMTLDMAKGVDPLWRVDALSEQVQRLHTDKWLILKPRPKVDFSCIDPEVFQDKPMSVIKVQEGKTRRGLKLGEKVMVWAYKSKRGQRGVVVFNKKTGFGVKVGAKKTISHLLISKIEVLKGGE